MGHLFFYPESSGAYRLYQTVKYWPYVISCIVTIIIALLMIFYKLRKRRYCYHQFYYLTLASICYIICGLLFRSKEISMKVITIYYKNILIICNKFVIVIFVGYHCAALIIGAVGHGVSHIVSLNYINIRLPAKCNRNIQISFHHFLYLLAFGVTSVLFNVWCTVRGKKLHDLVGPTILILGCLSLILLSLLEVLRCVGVHNNRTSLDDDLNVLNEQRSFLEKRKDILQEYERRNGLARGEYELERNRQCHHTFVSIFLKLQGAMLLSIILYSIVKQALSHYANVYAKFYPENLNYTVHVAMVAGALLGCVLQYLITLKNIMLMGTLFQIVSLVFGCIFYATYTHGIDGPVIAITYSIWMYFFFNGMTYSVADNLILQYTHFKFTEVVLALGFLMEMVPMAAVQYIRKFKPEILLHTGALHPFQAYAIVYMLINIILIILVAIYIRNPNTPSQSLVDNRNFVMGISFDTRVQNGIELQRNGVHLENAANEIIE